MQTAVVPSVERSESAHSAASRLAFIDHVRVFLTVLVVAHHAGQPYGPTGGSWPISHAEKARVLGPFFHVNASFFMGLFFLISGYFLPPAYDRKGPLLFLRERFRRLGIPVLGFGLLFVPAMVLLFGQAKGRAPGAVWLDTAVHFNWAHLWFLGHLLVYGLVYAAFRLVWKRHDGRSVLRPFPGSFAILAYVILLTAASALVRLKYPIDRWVTFVVPAELAHFPQYCSLFWFGVLAWHYRWLERIPAVTGRFWLGIGCVAVVARFWYWAARARFLGGSVWGDLIWIYWESLLCTGLCLGLLYGFRQHLNKTMPFGNFLVKNAYGVYLVHLPVLVILQVAVEKTSLGPLTLTGLTAFLAVVVSYAVTALLRFLPGAKRVI
jgi:glucans biosynthesis protein C